MVELQPIDVENSEQLIEYLTHDEWPYTGKVQLSRTDVLDWLSQGRFSSPRNLAFWIIDEGARVGVAVLREMQDDTPVVDLRLSSNRRGQGLGKQALRRLADYVFEQTPKVRIEAYTRADNFVMRSVLRGCGWAKEGHHRQSWRNQYGSRSDTASYSLLKQDWSSGTVTAVAWDDESKLNERLLSLLKTSRRN